MTVQTVNGARPELNLRALRRLRWAVRGALALGVAASVAANVLHARDDVIAQIISAWPPLALLLNIELISRVPMHRRYLAVIRFVATLAIAGIAAWVSYWHMTAVAARYGETGSAPFLLPISVDGIVVVASVSLMELAGRIRAAESAATAATTLVPVPALPPVPAPVVDRQPAPVAAPVNSEPADSPDDQPKRGLPPAERVRRWHLRKPDLTWQQIRDRLEVSESTARRYLAAAQDANSSPPAPVNGAALPDLVPATVAASPEE